MSTKSENKNVINFQLKKLECDVKKFCADITEESKKLRDEFTNYITSMYIVVMLLHNKTIEIQNIYDGMSESIELNFQDKQNMPEMVKFLLEAINIREHIRWSGFSKLPEKSYIELFSNLKINFEHWVNNYIETNVDHISISDSIELNADLVYQDDDIVEEYMLDNNLTEISSDVEDNIRTQAYNKEKIDTIKQFIFSII